jgi:transcriptional regulator GlxA family with amidase domain
MTVAGEGDALAIRVKQVAAATGFGSEDVMRRAFVRVLGITPGRYQRTVRAPAR